MSVIEVTSANFKEEIASGVCLVDFWAPWCGPCRALSPVIAKVADEMSSQAKIIKCNTEEAEEIAVELGITTIPTIILYKDGKEVERLGPQRDSVYIEKIKALL